MEYFHESIRVAERPATAKGKRAPVKVHRDVVAKAGLGGSELAPDRGLLFIADTAAQMRRAVKLITEVRASGVGSGHFGLIIDEADSFQRTEDDTLQLEQRLNDLKGTGHGWVNDSYQDTLNYGTYGGPSFHGADVIVSISATLLPVLLKMFKAQQEKKALETTRHIGEGTLREGEDRARQQTDDSSPVYTFFTKAPPSKYVGVLSEVWQPFKRGGKPVFLRPEEVKGTNLGGILDGHYRDPHVQLRLDGSVLALYADAAAMPYSLLLDITVSRVNVEGASLRDKAQWLAEHFENLTVITVDGLLLRYKLPSQNWDASSWVDGMKKREKTVEDLLNELEPQMNGAPVAIFGYSQMIRGDSFRSDWRVPTHILQQLSNAMSVDRLVQSAGRASFIGKELLDINALKTDGGEAGHVRVLLTDVDYLTVRAYVEFMNMLADEISKGKSVQELFDPSRVNRKYLGKFSILVADCQRRRIGNRNENLEGLLDKSLFQADLEAEAAYAASCACDEAAKHLATLDKRFSAATDEEKKLDLRRSAASKCCEIAAQVREAAERARSEAARSAKEAMQADVSGVRPSEKALMDANEAEEDAATAAQLASRAIVVVTLADVQGRVDKVVAAIEKAREKQTAKALDKVSDTVLASMQELMFMVTDLERGEGEREGEGEGERVERVSMEDDVSDKSKWICVESRMYVEDDGRQEIVAFCRRTVAELSGMAEELAEEARTVDEGGSASVKLKSERREKPVGGSKGETGAAKKEDKKALEREVKRMLKDLADRLKVVRNNLDAARKLHQKASELFESGETPAKSEKSGKARAQKLFAHASRMSTLAEESLSAAQWLHCAGAEDTSGAHAQEGFEAASQVRELAVEVAAEAVRAVTGEMEGGIKGAQDVCRLLRTGGGEQEEEACVSTAFLTSVSGRKKAAKHVEALRQTCEQLKSNKALLLPCRWARSERETQVKNSPREENQGGEEKELGLMALSPALARGLKEGMDRYRAACASVDAVVAEAKVLMAEVEELIPAIKAPAKDKAGAATGDVEGSGGEEEKGDNGGRDEEGSEEDEVVRKPKNGARGGKARRIIEDDEEA
jgi:hypothetical protein